MATMTATGTARDLLSEIDRLIDSTAPVDRLPLAVALLARVGKLAASAISNADPEALYDAGQIAALLDITKHRAYDLMRRHELPVVHLGERNMRVRRADLLDYIARRRVAIKTA
jgi:excisionase family DNA binding protein